MQNNKITLKHPLNQGIPVVQSNLSDFNDYLVYSSTITDNLVDENDVRDFLNDSKNINLATDFLNFLKNNSSNEEFENILYDNKKLADTLNSYYESTVVSGNAPNNSIITNQVLDSETVYFNNNNFTAYTPSNIKRINQTQSVLTDINTGNSIYIQVHIPIKDVTISVVGNGEYTKNTIESGATGNNILYIQGFVDLNNNDVAFNGLPNFNGDDAIIENQTEFEQKPLILTK